MRHRLFLVALTGALLFLYSAESGAPVVPVEPHVMPAPTEIYENEFSPDGSKCPGACGNGCPSSCQEEEFERCDPDNPGAVQSGKRYTCGRHPECSDLDDCLDECAFDNILESSTALERLLGIEPAWAPVIPVRKWRRPAVDVPEGDTEGGSNGPPDTNPDVGETACNAACVATASESAGPFEAHSWSEGGGPWKDAAIWEYTQESPNSPENSESCGQCETCRDGQCVHDPNACPDPEGDPQPPPAPMISSGDVHMTSLDRQRFDYQGAGEYVLIEDAEKAFVLQARTKPWSTYASLGAAAAMRVGDDVVGFYIDPQFQILLNGEAIDLGDDETLSLGGGGNIERSKSMYQVEWPDGSVVQIHKRHVDFSIAARLSDDRAGKVRGMVGDFDGDPDNDIFTRAGKLLPGSLTHEQLYTVFGHSWRISDDESLFVYGPGESTATYTDLDFPQGGADLSTFDPAALAAAEKACAGIEHPRLYRDCVFDVAITGDPSFADVHGADVPPQSEVEPPYMMFAAADDIGIEAPAEVPAGSDFAATRTGTRLAGDFVSVAEADAAALEFLSYRVVPVVGPFTLRAPERQGRYSIRYIQGNSIAYEQAIEVVAPLATVAAADSAPGGSTIEIDWSGPDGDTDYISISPVDPGNTTRPANYAYTRQGNPLPITVPDAPGQYEISYVQGQTRNVLRAVPLRVTPVAATLDAPDEALSGSAIEVAWTGPAHANDYLGIYTVDAENPNRGIAYQYTRDGNPLTINVPDEPGEYEVRYVQGQSGTAVTVRSITVTAVNATLEAPESAPSGSAIDVAWTGPDNPNDYLGIYVVEGDGSERGLAYEYTRTGSPLSLTVPDAPGDYEIRYVQGQSRAALIVRSITVTPVNATLEAPDEVVAGSQLPVSWTGPGNANDYLGIFTVDGEDAGRGVSYQYTRSGSPLQIAAPGEPGNYEIRYVQGQSRNELASKKLTVRAPD